jgi:cellulose synthase/poly-beta-1,6-N-acetylglucosamine synthase-like glycosyltransferase
MRMIELLWILLQVLIGYNLILPVILYLFSLLVKKRKQAIQPGASLPDYAIIVTAYEQTDSLPSVVSSLLKLNYGHYIIYIVADKCDVSKLHFLDEKVVLLRPEMTLASNTKSHFYAINHFIRPHSHLIIIDSDNLANPSLLDELNTFFAAGYQAVQGKRAAKNLDTTYACLDAARDIYYHFYDGEILFRLGSSATLSGSGMAFTVDLYRNCLENKPVEGAGFDKVLQSAIVSRNIRIAFAADALVYDEKTSKTDQLVQQRSRWINTWFKYYGYGFKLISKGIRNLSINQALFGLVLLRPPLFIFLLLSAACLFINLFVAPVLALYWFVAFILFILGFFIPFLNQNTDSRIMKALINIPVFIFYQLKSLLKARKANQHSVATKHYHTQASKPINEEL